jgi:hypothetical protein
MPRNFRAKKPHSSGGRDKDMATAFWIVVFVYPPRKDEIE